MNQEDIEKLINPIVVLGKGYFITDFRPGAIMLWRPLGCKDRPLNKLVEAELNIKHD